MRNKSLSFTKCKITYYNHEIGKLFFPENSNECEKIWLKR